MIDRGCWPLPDEDVLEALQRAYQDGSWGKYHGPNCTAFACQFAEYHETEFVRLTCSGTSAVEIGLAGLGLEPGDEVILAGYDFPGNFRAIEHLGALPVLVDVDSELRLIVDQIQDAFSGKTKAVIVSHLHGSLSDMPAIVDWARSRGVKTLEDACQAPGASIEGRRAGTWGDVGVHSFGGSKLLTAGRGGALLTQDPTVNQRMKIYAERGNDAYPMSELQAAVLNPQLTKLDARNQQRRLAAVQLASALKACTHLRVLGEDSLSEASCYKLGIGLSQSLLDQASRTAWIAEAQSHGIPIDIGFRSFAKRSARRCRKPGSLAQSQNAGDSLAVLHHPVLLTDTTNLSQLAAALINLNGR